MELLGGAAEGAEAVELAATEGVVGGPEGGTETSVVRSTRVGSAKLPLTMQSLRDPLDMIVGHAADVSAVENDVHRNEEREA